MYEARLKDVPFFSILDKKDLDIVAQQTDEVDVRDGQVLVRQGDLGQEFFVVESGTAVATIDEVRSNQNTEICVRIFPLSGMPEPST